MKDYFLIQPPLEIDLNLSCKLVKFVNQRVIFDQFIFFT